MNNEAHAEVRKQMVDEVKSLINHPENKSSGTCRRDFFREHSRFSEHAVKKYFGNFGELLREAQLVETRTDSQYDRRTAALVSEQRIQDYIKTDVMPWVATASTEFENELIHIVVASDFHGYHVDRFALKVFLRVIDLVQPHHVALAGDVFDFSEPSRWTQNPNKLLDLQGEIDFVVEEIMSPVKSLVSPQCDVKLFIGNHEYRIIRYLAERAPALASLRCLRFNELLKLDELGIDLVFGGDVLAPTPRLQKEAVTRAWHSYYNMFVVTHGTSTGAYPPLNELRRFHMSGCSGHVHTAQTVTARTIDRGLIEWHTLGMMCENDPTFCMGLPTNWNTGFGVVTLNTKAKTVHYRPVRIENGTAMFDGHYFKDGDLSD